MGKLCASGVDQNRFCADHPPILIRNPSTHPEGISGNGTMAEPYPKFSGERLCSSGGYGLGHGFIKDSTHDPAMHDAFKPFQC